LEETYKTKIVESSKIIEIKTRELDEMMKKYDYETKDLREALALER
jgi:hypothetical protein